mmetsp:Transcript_11892/g.20205  ORF Transcript_11892/g.20205 Transcript_11892/m.20205 type:complete len:93 (+) Transcript_11892:71-349(+)
MTRRSFTFANSAIVIWPSELKGRFLSSLFSLFSSSLAHATTHAKAQHINKTSMTQFSFGLLLNLALINHQHNNQAALVSGRVRNSLPDSVNV